MLHRVSHTMGHECEYHIIDSCGRRNVHLDRLEIYMIPILSQTIYDHFYALAIFNTGKPN